jgi:hypothetical protein
MMRSWPGGMAMLAGLLAGVPGGAALAAPTVEVRDAAARIVVVPENRSDVKVEFASLNPSLPLYVRQRGQRLIVDGRLRRRIAGCRTEFGMTTVRVRGLGEVSIDNLPRIVAKVPLDARVAASGAVFGQVGRTETLELSNAGCGDWQVANVKGVLKLNLAGEGDTRTGTSGELIAHVAGAGDVFTNDVAGGLTVDLAGSGDVSAASINGPLHARIAGSGDVKVARGHASELTADIAGSGDVRFGGTADSVRASIAGSGDVDVGAVTGQIRKSILGSGDVIVGH